MQRTWLANIRTELKLTHQGAALKAKIDRSFYTQIESGVRNPSVDTAKKIANALNFEWTLFFDQESCKRQQNVFSA